MAALGGGAARRGQASGVSGTPGLGGIQSDFTLAASWRSGRRPPSPRASPSLLPRQRDTPGSTRLLFNARTEEGAQGPGSSLGTRGGQPARGSPARSGLTREDEGARGGGSWETLRKGKSLAVTSREVQGRQPAWGPRGGGSGGQRGHGVHPHSSDRTSIPQGLQRSVLLAPTAL